VYQLVNKKKNYLQNQSSWEEKGLLYLPHYILQFIFLKHLFWYHLHSVTLKIGAIHFFEMLLTPPSPPRKTVFWTTITKTRKPCA